MEILRHHLVCGKGELQCELPVTARLVTQTFLVSMLPLHTPYFAFLWFCCQDEDGAELEGEGGH